MSDGWIGFLLAALILGCWGWGFGVGYSAGKSSSVPDRVDGYCIAKDLSPARTKSRKWICIDTLSFVEVNP